MIRNLSLLLLLLLLAITPFTACSDKEDNMPPFLTIEENDKIQNFSSDVGVREINVKTSFNQWQAKVNDDAISWISAVSQGSKLKVSITQNQEKGSRNGNIIVTAGSFSETIQVVQMGAEPAILIGTEIYRIKSNGEIIDIEVTSNIEYDIIIPEDVDWIVKADMQTRNEMITANYKYEIKPNDDKERRSIISIKGKNDNINRSIEVIQDKFEVDLDKETSKDVRISVLSAKVENNEFQPGAGIERTIDGDYNTSFHTRWSGSTVFPVVFSYHFKEGVAQDIDYALLYGTTSYNGKIKEMNVYVKEFGSNEVQFGKTLDLKGEGGNQFIDLGLKNVEYVKFEVLSGTGTENGYVAFREIEFFGSITNRVGSHILVYLLRSKSY